MLLVASAWVALQKNYTQLLLIEDGNQLLEVKIPCLSVHEQHDPLSPADLQGLCPLPEVEEKVKILYSKYTYAR